MSRTNGGIIGKKNTYQSGTWTLDSNFNNKNEIRGIGGIDEHTVLLLHGDNYKDVSGNDNKVIGYNTVISTDGRFNKALSFNGTNSWVDLGINDPFNSYYWTLDWWEKRTSPTNNLSAILSKYGNPYGQVGLLISYTSESIPYLYFSSDGTGWNVVSASKLWTYNLDVWTHYAVVRNNTRLLYFKNGVKTEETFVGNNLPYNNGRNYRMGYYYDGQNTIKGLIAEYRVSDVARWTKDFIVPSEQYTIGETNEENLFNQPVLTSNGTLGGDSFAILPESEYSASYKGYMAFNNETNYWHSAQKAGGAGTTLYMIFYNPTPIKVISLGIANRKDSPSVVGSTGVALYGSHNNIDYVFLATMNNSNTGQNDVYTLTVNSKTNYKYHKIIFTAPYWAETGTYAIIHHISINGYV